MTRTFGWTRRELWTRKLLYPGHTLPTAAAPVIVGFALAVRDHVFSPLPLALAFLAGWLIQFGGVVTDNHTNLVRQPDDEEHPELVHALESGLLSLHTLRTTILASYGLAVLLGLVLLALAGWPVIVIGLGSILASWAYSAGPFPVGRHGLADPVFFLCFGTVSVVGTYFVQAAAVLGPAHWRLALPLSAVAVSLPIGALITSILVIDDIRDCAFDRQKGKRTIAVRFGRRWSRVEFTALLGLAYLVPFWLWRGWGFTIWVLLPLVTLPAAVQVTRTVWTKDHLNDLVPMTPRTAMLTVAYSFCLAAGIAARV